MDPSSSPAHLSPADATVCSRRTAETRGLQFWEALDVKLDREVALTFVDADQRGDDDSQSGPQAVLSRTLRLGRINSPGLARVLDVVRGSSGGIVVAEWTPRPFAA